MKAMNTTESISADCIIQGVIDRYPWTIGVFTRHGLQCVGCYIAPFHTIADCAREHDVALELLLADLNQVPAATKPATAPRQ